MMRRLVILTVFLLFGALAPPAPAALLWVSPSLERTAAGCDEGAACASIKLTWPEFVRGLWPRVQRDIRGWVGYDPWADRVRTPYELTGAFLRAWDIWQRQAGPETPPWYIEREVTIVTNTPALLGICFMENSLTDDSGPHSYRRYRMYRYTDGTPLSLEELLRPGGRPLLERRVEAALRSQPGAPHFTEGPFQLPRNLVLESGGLRLYYNDDEMGAGTPPVELLLPWDDVGALIRPEFRLE